MKISTNLIRFNDEFGIKKTIDIYSEAGYEAIDFSAELSEYYTDEHDETFYRDIKQYALDRGITFDQAHAPIPSSFEDSKASEKRFFEIVNSMKHAAWLGAKMIVVHPCHHSSNYGDMMDATVDLYKRLAPYAKEFGIKIATENIKYTITETIEGFLELIDRLDDDVFTVCYDVGHCVVCGVDPIVLTQKLGNRIGCTHIHDHDGIKDHTIPLLGSIDWDGVMKAFAEVGYEGNLNYEAGRFLDNVPLCLRADGAKYMASVENYLRQRFLYHKNNL